MRVLCSPRFLSILTVFALFHGRLGQRIMRIVGCGNDDKVNVAHVEEFIGTLDHGHPWVHLFAIVVVSFDHSRQLKVG